jgi:transcriptional regulator GlxA family with amidase domain
MKDAGPCPHALFDALADGLREMSPSSQRRMVAIAAELFARAGEPPKKESDRAGEIVGRFVKLAQDNYANASVNVNALADIIGAHRTTLSRVFKERMLLSPGEYLMRIRMQRALSLLKETSLPIAEVAALSGIPDPTYFHRRVRLATGLGPKEFRNAGLPQ